MDPSLDGFDKVSELDPEAPPPPVDVCEAVDEVWDPTLVPDADGDVVAFDPPETEAPLAGTRRLTVN
jgi:hypothetical protein